MKPSGGRRAGGVNGVGAGVNGGVRTPEVTLPFVPCGAIGVFMSQQASGMLRSVDLCQVQAEQPGVAEHAAQHATLLFCRLCPTAVSAFAIPRCMISNPSHAILVAQAISSASTKARTVGRTSVLLCKIGIIVKLLPGSWVFAIAASSRKPK